MSYTAYVLIDKTRMIDFATILRLLNEPAIEIVDETRASLSLGEYQFEFVYVQSEAVFEESEGMVRNSKNDKLRSDFVPSDVRVEVFGGDDPDLDYIDYFNQITTLLSRSPSLAVYEEQSGEFV